MNLDLSRLAEARAAVAAGERLVERNCSCCQGMSLPGVEKGRPGYCPDCNGTAYVSIPAWMLDPRRGVDYWQARTLVALAENAELLARREPACPDCSGQPMGLVEANYHGTGEDVFQCPACKHVYAVVYCIAEVNRLPDWERE